jgi:hypothetical protein
MRETGKGLERFYSERLFQGSLLTGRISFFVLSSLVLIDFQVELA